LLFFVGYFPSWLATWAERQIANSVEGAFSSAQLVRVDLGAGNLGSWARGQLHDLKIEAKGLRTKDAFPISAFFFEAELLQLDLARLRQGKVKILSSRRARATAILSEGELTGYLQKRVKPLTAVRMELREGKATVHGQTRLLGQKVKLSIAGEFSPSKGELRFKPTDFFVADFKLPRFLLDNIGDEVEFTIPLVELPLPLELESVRIENGNAYLTGRGDKR
jgi:hypothetical protein